MSDFVFQNRILLLFFSCLFVHQRHIFHYTTCIAKQKNRRLSPAVRSCFFYINTHRLVLCALKTEECLFCVQHVVDGCHQGIDGSHDDILVHACSPEILAILVCDSHISDST